MGWWTNLKARYEGVVETYGRVAVGTYVVLMVLSFAGVWIAINLGFEVEGVASGAGAIGATYAGYKLLQPVRIVGAIVLTPLVATAWRKLRPEASVPSVREDEPAAVDPRADG